MRIIPNRILVIIALCLLSFASVAAPNDPPPPTPPPPPGSPIDGGVLLLFTVSLLYGFYIVYQYNAKKNAAN
jgi:hypothetical protein